METVEEQSIISSSKDDVKTHLNQEMPTDVADSNVCHRPNGVDCASSNEIVTEQVAENSMLEAISTEAALEVCENSTNVESQSEDNNTTETENCIDSEKTETKITADINNAESRNSIDPEICEPQYPNEDIIAPTDVVCDAVTSKEIVASVETVVSNNEVIDPPTKDHDENEHTLKPCSTEEAQVNEDKYQENDLVLSSTEELCNVEPAAINDGIHFETEVLVEKNDNDVNENVIETEYIITETVSASPNNILSELGENIELSEVLQSSDVRDSAENNNAIAGVEVFNKEELLDILEGKDVGQTHNDDSVLITSENKHLDSELESQRAQKQLSLLKKTRKKRAPRTSKYSPKEYLKVIKKSAKENVVNKADSLENKIETQPEIVETIQEKDNNIINELVMDWEDEEQPDINPEGQNDSENKLVESDKEKQEDHSEINDQPTGWSSVDSSVSEDQQQKQIKSEDESSPGAPRRLGRVIKKKVIFDPDNPDTFTKTPSKTKEIQHSKEQPPFKKGKIETSNQEKRKSRSPSSKLQWKKPSPKNSKQHKRLSEVDRLLMDEGAVNMIYQLTPEAPKGRKNVKTKAEFIKKIQSSTPDGKEMKFRERKKEAKYEDGETRKLLGSKHRPSLSSSVKSPSVSEDFETHSADDSIIYRRHSSSSYSSSCMSPRRLSDVEGNSQHTKPHQISSQPRDTPNIDESQHLNQDSNSFLSDANSSIITDIKTELINKEDCLSLKEKLNSKLSLALNKRKRDNTKSERPTKQKKLLKSEEKHLNKKEDLGAFQFVLINIDQHLAEICFKKTGLKNDIEVFNEIEQALKYVDENPDISVTLLSSQCGTLCSSLDLSLLLQENSEIRTKNAYELAESVRSLLATMSRHSKLLCCGVWGACSGVSVAVVALCDVALASECATFALAAAAAPTLPGAAALAAPHRALPQPLVNDLVVFGRRISAAEALRGGLISRALWPDRFDEQVKNIVMDIAIQPPQAILLKKRLLGLNKSGEAETMLLSRLESERDLVVQYWTSVEGQELLRTVLDAA